MASGGYQSRSRAFTPVYDVISPQTGANFRNGSSHNNTSPHYYKGVKNGLPSGIGRNSNHGPRPGQAICIGEEVKIAVHMAIDNFRSNECQKELEFPSSLNASERAYIHRLAESLGLKSKSRGKNSNRFLTVTKKNNNVTQRQVATFNLEKNSRQHIRTLMQRYPLTNKERQDLFPKPEKSLGDGRDIMKTSVGRLSNGVPQVPPKSGESTVSGLRETLPIYQHSDEILQALDSHQVVLVTGETGSGKTTQVPQIILNDHHNKGKLCRIFCAQPRRIAALSIAERVSAERGEKIGQIVGYQIRLESKVSPRTLLIFCTTGVLLRTLMGSDAALNTVTHIIVDEIHERDRYSDFLLITLRDVLPRFKNLKLVLMSAALNTELFINYFSNCAFVSIPGTLFEVKEYFLEDVLKWTNYSTKAMERSKRELSNVEKQQKQLSDWCSRKLSLTNESEDKPYRTKMAGKNLEVLDKALEKSVEEKDELEPWLIKEMDQLLTDAWLTDSEEAFEQIFNLIINESISVDYKHSETSATALMIATGRGYFDVVERLLSLGASVNVQASNDWTVFEWAKKFQRAEILELLESYRNSPEDNVTSDTVLVKSSENMTPQDRELLNIYHQCFDDDKIDKDLIICLIHKICTTSSEGAILVFLPGYEDIVGVKEKILEEKRFESIRYILFMLHSSMQSLDQKRVFKSSPPGVRKIILSTNIAETSLTINDVVYVIDSGKMKEKSFDAFCSVTMLKTHWVSKANALQRKGRAGRVQPGVCYHLFSRIRHDNLEQYQVPELLRLPLHELCLQTKMIAPSNTSIADFLSNAIQAPSFLIIRNALQLLKQIDALDPWEDLTELGHHLADFPIAPSLGKMVLYSVVLKCLDPVLTIVCSLANKDPFLIPGQPSQRRAANLVRKKLSANTYSEHMILLRAFQAWQKARTEGWEKTFCEKHFLSSASMEMIIGMRAQLLGQLRASGFVRARGGGDIRDLNINSEKWCVVKAALCAGLYPNVLRIDRVTGQLLSAKEMKIRLHNLSVFSPNLSASQRNTDLSSFPSDWIIYEEMSRNSSLAFVRCCTVISPITVALFAGPAKLSPEVIKEAESGQIDERKCHDFTRPHDLDNVSDSGEEENEEMKKSSLRLDEWLSFQVDSESSSLVLQLRQKWYSLFIRRMRAPSKPWTQTDEAIVRSIVEVLVTEERELGLQQPAGIGQRPISMAAESILSSVGNQSCIDSEDQNDDRSRMAKRSSALSASSKKKDSTKYRCDNKTGNNSNLSHFNSNLSLSGNINYQGSRPNTPGDTSQPSSPTKRSEKDPGATSSHPCRMFLMKCNNQRNLDTSFSKSIWTTSPNNEKKLNKAFQDGKTVYLIFSIQGSGCFQGYAKMLSTFSKDRSAEYSMPGLGATCTVDWLKRGNIPFHNVQHLSNPWNDNKRIQVSRDCQEIEPFVGETLLKQWDKLGPHYSQKRPITKSSLENSSHHNSNKPLYTQANNLPNTALTLSAGLNGCPEPGAYNLTGGDIFSNPFQGGPMNAKGLVAGSKQSSNINQFLGPHSFGMSGNANMLKGGGSGGKGGPSSSANHHYSNKHGNGNYGNASGSSNSGSSIGNSSHHHNNNNNNNSSNNNNNNNKYLYRGGGGGNMANSASHPCHSGGHLLGIYQGHRHQNMIGGNAAAAAAAAAAAGLNPMYMTPMMQTQAPPPNHATSLPSSRHGMSPVVILQRGNTTTASNSSNSNNNNNSASSGQHGSNQSKMDSHSMFSNS
ncbi:3'-5' RNA helicase YTHDC2-like isoform X2 [Octopus sinensis]|uniref:3'-5' RNA helicase YTHDC2-like isoform X2 n=1 Tax=Octopus sinensis TaxID=2607531 RepID=A0A7E6FEE7_9MOLL|nr:3'-5' RNA helicase YTHDC2-like isoform X2 [Octopus sinensis]